MLGNAEIHGGFLLSPNICLTRLSYSNREPGLNSYSKSQNLERIISKVLKYWLLFFFEKLVQFIQMGVLKVGGLNSVILQDPANKPSVLQFLPDAMTSPSCNI